MAGPTVFVVLVLFFVALIIGLVTFFCRQKRLQKRRAARLAMDSLMSARDSPSPAAHHRDQYTGVYVVPANQPFAPDGRPLRTVEVEGCAPWLVYSPDGTVDPPRRPVQPGDLYDQSSAVSPGPSSSGMAEVAVMAPPPYSEVVEGGMHPPSYNEAMEMDAARAVH
ncbi:uncharacterized protein LOC143296049 [Babylonia areolata]|uniref:uncharacterized protein LOC143296049 n=1 Tax=Babylonia areolata TaxID=304850 RepID=UPI003FD456AE